MFPMLAFTSQAAGELTLWCAAVLVQAGGWLWWYERTRRGPGAGTPHRT